MTVDYLKGYAFEKYCIAFLYKYNRYKQHEKTLLTKMSNFKKQTDIQVIHSVS